jgi:hypothetical protein
MSLSSNEMHRFGLPTAETLEMLDLLSGRRVLGVEGGEVGVVVELARLVTCTEGVSSVRKAPDLMRPPT